MNGNARLPSMFREAKKNLMDQTPSRLANLPKDKKGIYLLFSHTGKPLYLGITASTGFYDRIFNRHVRGTGRDGNSHKFGWGYNVGPFYLARFNGSEQFTTQGTVIRKADIKFIRDIRAKFLRKHCTASFHPILRPNSCSTDKEFKKFLETNYETPIKRELQLPWQDNKNDSVIAYNPGLKSLIWQFIEEQQLNESELKVLKKMEYLFEH
tara:strand:- start:2503 stop:3132 length:630 start_codon:yes stop_codon:yes gene_type:complete